MEHVDLVDLYRSMSLARNLELALADLWAAGLISGEMHLATGEEAVAAGVVAHLEAGDAVALDHRPTAVMTMLGVDMVAMLREMLGYEDGLCGGMGGHMHLFDPERRVGSSGIVGAAGPLATGFALAGRQLRRKSVAVGFFGDGAANQGMLMESMNLASAWSLPVLFVCKNNQWAVTTRSAAVTGGDLRSRAEAFGLRTDEVDGLDVVAVYEAVGETLSRVRRGKGPAFLLAHCSRLDGHFLGDLLIRAAEHPVAEGGAIFGKVVSSAVRRRGGRLASRVASMGRMMALMRRARKDHHSKADDPLVRTRKRLRSRRDEVARVDEETAREVARAVEDAVAGEDAPEPDESEADANEPDASEPGVSEAGEEVGDE